MARLAASAQAPPARPPQASAAASKPGRRARRATTLAAPGYAAELQVQLVQQARLPAGTARRVAAAQGAPGSSGIPADPAQLCSRVAALQDLLGEQRAAAAIHRCPNILASRPDTLARNQRAWLQFFAPDEPDGRRGSGARDALLSRLAAMPQLLAVDVERLVANLYETGAIVSAKDLHSYALTAMQLALAQPQGLQDKMAATLAFLNSQPGPEPPAGAAAAPVQQARRSSSLQPAAFRLEDLQQAARRDFRWLKLSSETLHARLAGLQQALQVPLPVVGRMFLLQPSLVNKTTALLAGRAAALQQLPGLGSARALGALTAFPALLNVQSETAAHRWQQLQAAAATSPDWRQQLDALPPASLAGLLIRSQVRFGRLAAVAARGEQGSVSLQSLLIMSQAKYDARFAG